MGNELIGSILQAFAGDITDKLKLKVIVEPSIVTPSEPHVRILAGAPNAERKDNYAIREWDGKIYTATSYSILMPVEMSLQAWGQEEAIKRIFFDYALKVSLYFELSKQYTINGTLEWDGVFIADVKQSDNEMMSIEANEEGSGQIVSLRAWGGFLVFDYYAIGEETEKAKTIVIQGG